MRCIKYEMAVQNPWFKVIAAKNNMWNLRLGEMQKGKVTKTLCCENKNGNCHCMVEGAAKNEME